VGGRGPGGAAPGSAGRSDSPSNPPTPPKVPPGPLPGARRTQPPAPCRRYQPWGQRDGAMTWTGSPRGVGSGSGWGWGGQGTAPGFPAFHGVLHPPGFRVISLAVECPGHLVGPEVHPTHVAQDEDVPRSSFPSNQMGPRFSSRVASPATRVSRRKAPSVSRAWRCPSTRLPRTINLVPAPSTLRYPDMVDA